MRLSRSLKLVKRRLPALALGLGAVTLIATPAAAVPGSGDTAAGKPANPTASTSSADLLPGNTVMRDPAAGKTVAGDAVRAAGWTAVPGTAQARSAPATATYGGDLHVFVQGPGGQVRANLRQREHRLLVRLGHRPR